MRRDHYRLFSEGRIGPLLLPNRLVRSATWDPSILGPRRMSEEVLAVYERVAEGGAGLIITGDVSVVPPGLLDEDRPVVTPDLYEQVRIEGYSRLADTVHRAAPRAKIVAQLSADYQGVAPSELPSPWSRERPRPLTTAQVRARIIREAVDRARQRVGDFAILIKMNGCISCNSCLYDMYTSLDRGEPGIVTCLAKQDPGRIGEAQRWLARFVKDNVVT